MIIIAFFVLIFQAMTLAGVLTLMEEKNGKAGEKPKTHVYRKMGELEARRILRDLANEMTTTAEETAAIDTALERQWCHLDGPCEYGNPEIKLPEEEVKAAYKELNESAEMQELCEEGEKHGTT